MRALVACEYSGRVRHLLSQLGWDATSCDLLPTEIPDKHYQGDVRNILYDEWNLIIAFPPCTHLACSGARYFKEKIADGRQQEAIDFFMLFANHPCKHIAIENPIGIMSTRWRRPDQIIQPWEHGHGETKATCLWLKNLPKITPTEIVSGREHRIWRMPPGPFRAKERSKTYYGIAKAMTYQWTEYLNIPLNF